eukprot:Hpha_TRINITY_DN15187_c5_g5::TRINITY_DN15187_c5_g5_i1::g.129459::m.129459/K10359/MYO7A, USH1B; myosin VIIa
MARQFSLASNRSGPLRPDRKIIFGGASPSDDGMTPAQASHISSGGVSLIDPYSKGNLVFFQHAEEGWLLGRIQKIIQRRGERLFAVTPASQRQLSLHRNDQLWEADDLPEALRSVSELPKMRKDEILTTSISALDPVPDLLLCSRLTEAAVLQQLRSMFARREAYVYVGSESILSLNPGRHLEQSFGDELLHKYVEQQATRVDKKLPPHVWEFVQRAYWRMLSDGMGEARKQALVFTGCAGSGKTEGVKLSLRAIVAAAVRLANPGGPKERCERMGNLLMNTLLVLNSFGNASTSRHPNSSRSMKWLDVFISPAGALLGACHKVLLLERTRVVQPPDGERTFHCFYQLVAGLDTATRRRLGLGDRSSYDWLFKQVVPAAGDEAQDAERYTQCRTVMKECGFQQFELDTIDQILAGIIHLRRVNLQQDDPHSAAVWMPRNEDLVRVAAALWGLEPHRLFAEVASYTTIVRGHCQTKRLSAVQALEARDRVCQVVYSGLFGWILRRLNEFLAPPPATRGTLMGGEAAQQQHMSIGIMDIMGFEDDNRGNGIEQLITNALSEHMQGLHNARNFDSQMQECKEEGINLLGLTPPDTAPNLELVAGKCGILALLDEQASTQAAGLGNARADMRFLERVSIYNGRHPALRSTSQQGTFGVQHSAGLVWYGPVGNWRVRNTNPLTPNLKKLLCESTNLVVQALLPDGEDGELGCEIPIGSLAQQYHTAAHLMDLLLDERQAWWVRCVRPALALGSFIGSDVLLQLRRTGLLEMVLMQRYEYTVRPTHTYFLERYGRILGVRGPQEPDEVSSIVAVLSAVSLDSNDAKVGRTKVFLKKDGAAKLDRVLHDVISHGLPEPDKLERQRDVVVAMVRGWLAQLICKARAQNQFAADDDDDLGVTISDHQQLLDEDGEVPGVTTMQRREPKIRIDPRWTVLLDQPQGEALPKIPVSVKELQAACKVQLSCEMPDLDEHKVGEPHIEPPSISLPSEVPPFEELQYQSLILKDAEHLEKMDIDALYEVISQGRRETVAALKLSKEAISAIRQLVKQYKLHQRYMKRRLRSGLSGSEDARLSVMKQEFAGVEESEIRGFPNQFGPFCVKPLPTGGVENVVGLTYTLRSGGTLADLSSRGIEIKGQVSDMSLITLPPDIRKKAYIPSYAKYFCFAYPIPGLRELAAVSDQTGNSEQSAEVMFVTEGGFIYLDERNRPVGANALRSGPGLWFEGPFPWASEEGVLELRKKKRLQEVIKQEYVEAGAKFFAWLLPGEDFGVNPAPCHGGFLYLFRGPEDPPDKRDRYFIVAGGPPTEAQQEQEAMAMADDKHVGVQGEPLEQLPQIEGEKDLEGEWVPRRLREIVQQVIDGDHGLSKVRLKLEPLDPSTQVQIEKTRTAAHFRETGDLFSPLRHHRRGPDEFIDIPGGYLGWTPNGLKTVERTLDFSGKTYPFQTGVSTLMSPHRPRPFFMHTMQSNARTACGKSVDWHWDDAHDEGSKGGREDDNKGRARKYTQLTAQSVLDESYTQRETEAESAAQQAELLRTYPQATGPDAASFSPVPAARQASVATAFGVGGTGAPPAWRRRRQNSSQPPE